MGVLQALKILEDTTLDCKERVVNTPEVHRALDIIEFYIRTQWHTVQFRGHLERPIQPSFKPGDDGEGQQQILSVSFAGIHAAVRATIEAQLGLLGLRYLRTKDAQIKIAIDRLYGILETMPARWEFTPRQP